MIRKALLIFIMTILIVLLGYTVYAGIKVGSFEIPSYIRLDEKSQSLNELILEYESKNSSELMQMKP